MYHGVAMGAATPTVTPPISRVLSISSNAENDNYTALQQQHCSSTQIIDYNDVVSPRNKVTADSKSSRADVTMSPPTAPGAPPAAHGAPAAWSGHTIKATSP